MTDVDLLTMALAPTLPVKPIRGVAWHRRCNFCSAVWVRDCMALALVGLPLRCEEKSAEDVQTLEKMLIEALKQEVQ